MPMSHGPRCECVECRMTNCGAFSHKPLPPFSAFLLPCPICNGVEGCDHTVLERAKAESERRKQP